MLTTTGDAPTAPCTSPPTPDSTVEAKRIDDSEAATRCVGETKPAAGAKEEPKAQDKGAELHSGSSSHINTSHKTSPSASAGTREHKARHKTELKATAKAEATTTTVVGKKTGESAAADAGDSKEVPDKAKETETETVKKHDAPVERVSEKKAISEVEPKAEIASGDVDETPVAVKKKAVEKKETHEKEEEAPKNVEKSSSVLEEEKPVATDEEEPVHSETKTHSKGSWWLPNFLKIPGFKPKSSKHKEQKEADEAQGEKKEEVTKEEEKEEATKVTDSTGAGN